MLGHLLLEQARFQLIGIKFEFVRLLILPSHLFLLLLKIYIKKAFTHPIYRFLSQFSIINK